MTAKSEEYSFGVEEEYQILADDPSPDNEPGMKRARNA